MNGEESVREILDSLPPEEWELFEPDAADICRMFAVSLTLGALSWVVIISVIVGACYASNTCPSWLMDWLK